MWLVIAGLCVACFVIGATFGVVYMKQANDEYKVKLEKALKEARAPYEVLTRDKQEVKNDESAWW